MIIAALTFLLPVAAACGWFVGRREERPEDTALLPKKLRRDYFKGLNYLINEEPDKAVDVFIKLLEVDSDTVETHLALGSLFRRRGEVDRAIRVHQNLIARPQLNNQHRLEALSELGQDYLRAGVLDRAERLFLELSKSGDADKNSLHFLLHIYQQEKDWQKAIEIAQQLQVKGESMRAVIAQYNCELAEQALDKGMQQRACEYLKRAQSSDYACVRASLIEGRIASEQGYYKEAIRHYKAAIAQDPDYLPEVVSLLVECYQKMNEQAKMLSYLRECLVRYPRFSLVLAIANYLQADQGDMVAIEFLAEQMQRQPSLRGLCFLVELYVKNSIGDAREKLLILQNFMHRLLADKPIYRCEHCGYAGKTLFWLCPSCHCWNTIKPIQGLEGN